jgi:hypothetical protein
VEFREGRSFGHDAPFDLDPIPEPEGGNAASPIVDIDFGMKQRAVAILAAASVS